MATKKKKKSVIFGIGILSFMFVSCGNKDLSKPAEPWENITIVTQEIVVSETENCPEYTIVEKTQYDLSKFAKDEDGYYILFDGKTLNGWRGYDRDDMPSRWVIDDEAIKITGRVRVARPEGAQPGGTPSQGPQSRAPLSPEDSIAMVQAREAAAREGGDIIFGHKFKNFELSVDWKGARGANSGIFYLGQEIKGQPIYISAPECAIQDGDNPRFATGIHSASSLYDMIAADPQNAKPFGEWNNTTIIINKGAITHIQNGEVVVQYNPYTPQWTTLLQDSKFNQEEWPLAFELLNNLGGKNREGYIGLQDHGSDVWFRNIRIKILD